MVDFQPLNGYISTMIRRNLQESIVEALTDTPVVFLAGARQTGKTTLALELAKGPHPARYVSLDDTTLLGAAITDPHGFLAGFDEPLIVDEVQRVPQLLLAIKAAVDRDRKPGKFLLTGSADVLAIPRVSDTLVGRMEVATLWPFSQGERSSIRDGFVDTVFSSRLPETTGPDSARRGLIRQIVAGGFPEAVSRKTSARRDAWFRSYLDTVLRREVRDLAAIEGLAQLPQLLGLIAARSGSLASYADLSRGAQIPQTTVKRYLALLEATFLVHRIPAWSGNLTTRLVKAPKLYLTDSGLACFMLGFGEDHLHRRPNALGGLLEGFVAGELARQIGWSRIRPSLFHFRTHTGREVDLVLEDRSGRCVAIEVKAGASISPRDLRGLRAFSDHLGSRFKRGIVLYGGEETVPFADNLHAVPISALWAPGGD